MAIKIDFDVNGNPKQPTLVLMTRAGRKLGAIPATNFQFKDIFNSHSEGRFDVYKASVTDKLWDKLVDFKLVWAKEWNKVFEVICEVHDDRGKLYKSCSLTSLGISELSQINLYGIEINTENDIARSDYEPTVIYDPFNSKASLLNRISEKIPHYSFARIDSRIAKIQRTFTFDGTPIWNALTEIAEEINSIVIADCYINDDGKLCREISMYDLESYCEDCGARGPFDKVCDECGGTNIVPGYGHDTTIFISKDNLADNITLSTDDGSVKNCFKLVAGDDLMTATIANMNPNGSSYIWHLSELVKSDMSDELVEKLETYNSMYDDYQTSHEYALPADVITNYNGLIDKYKEHTQDYPSVANKIVGYPALMQAYYEVLGFYYFLGHTLMPVSSIEATNASKEATNIIETFDESYSNIVSVRSDAALANLSVSTANSTVLQVVKSMVNQAYKVSISGEPTLSEAKKWNGTISLVNYSDEEDKADVPLSLVFNSDYESFVVQSLDRTLYSKNTDEVTDMTSLFRLPEDKFIEYLKKYSLACLKGINDACQSCVDLLIQQGIADGQTWGDTLYDTLYVNGYYKRLGLIESELALREKEIGYIEDMMNGIVSLRDATQDSLDFEKYLGDLWLEFSAYRREDVYQNDNYISDGLSDDELFENARQFLSVATKELYRSAELQHSISATVKNFLVMKEFKPIVDHFETGNWLRVEIDKGIYKLRLLEYEVNFESPQQLPVTFSDVRKTFDAVSDVRDVLEQASSMASSYDSVKRQAKQGSKSYDTQTGWVADGLALTTMQITNNAENQDIVWDDKGMLFREYDVVTDTYDDAQLKIINHGLYITDDNWQTARAGIGKFNIWNPETQNTEELYGVVADTVVGRLILGEKMYIANEGGNFKVDDKGITISNDYNQIKFNPNSNRLLDIVKENNHIMYLDNEGNLNITGNITATSGSFTGTITSADGEIGGWKITSNAIYKGTNSATSTTAGLYLGNDAIRGYTDSTHYFTFSKGTINATGATISGALTATSGSIGGFQLDSNSIHTANVAVTSNASNSVGLSSSTFTRTINGTSRSNLKLAIGQYFGVSNTGILYAGSAIISGDLSTGNLKATGGTIGGFQIDSTSIHTSNVAVTSNASNSLGLSSSTFTRTINGTSRGNLKLAIGQYFGVSNTGILYAGSAIISGDLTTGNLKATGGSIGGWTIGSSAIYNGTTSMTSTASGTYIGTSGIRQYTSSTRYVNISGGTLVAAGASISGSITATTGQIGGWAVTSNQIYKEATVSGDTYKVRLYAPTTPKGTDVAIMVTGGTITQEDTSWHYYGEWGYYEWPNNKWYRLEKDNGEKKTIYYLDSNGNISSDWYFYGDIVEAGPETRGDHSSTFQSYTKILYNGTLDCVELYYTNMHSNSDRKLKEDITYIDINKSAELVYSLKPVSYRYKSNNSILHHGLIAQDVEESALYDTWDVVSESYEGNKTLNYVEMIADLIATVQQLNNRVKQLEEKG